MANGLGLKNYKVRRNKMTKTKLLTHEDMENMTEMDMYKHLVCVDMDRLSLKHARLVHIFVKSMAKKANKE